MLRMLLICIISTTLIGCAAGRSAQLEQGRRYFDGGYYKGAFEELLPIAGQGNAEAQYAVGYMYYYGYGVQKNQKMGKFWVKEAADQHYKPAVRALKIINKSNH